MPIVRPTPRAIVAAPDEPIRGGSLPWDGIGGGAPVAWTPAALGSKLTLHLIGGTGLTQVAGPKISAWADQSGNGRDFTQSTDANRPLVSSVNGITCPDFTGASVALLSGAVTQASFFTASAYELWLVVNLDSVGSRRIWGETTETKGAELRTVGTGAQSINWDAGGADATTQIALSTGTTYHVGTRLSGGTLTCDAAGTTQTVASGNTADLTGLSRLLPDGRVAHVVACNAVLSADERTLLKAYFAARYGSV